MIVPLWYLLIWGASALAYAAACVMVFRRGLFLSWPSLFFISLDHVVFFAVSHFVIGTRYPIYIRYFWADTIALAFLQVWLGWDVFRSMPSSPWFPAGVKRWTMVGAMLVGTIAFRLTAPKPGPFTYTFSTKANVGAQFALIACAVFVLFSIRGMNGLGFTLTGFRIMAAAIVRLVSFFLLSILFPLVLSDIVARRALNTADTAVSLCTALYWTYALAKSRDVQIRREQAWASLATQSRGEQLS